MTPSADLRARVLAAASQEPTPTRAAIVARNLALLASGIVVPLLVFVSWGGIRSAPRPNTLVWETASGAFAVALTAAILALSRGRSMLGRPGVALISLALGTPVVLFAWKVFFSSRYPGMMVEWPERPGLRCLTLSCLTAAWPLVAAVTARRGSDPTHPRLTGAAIGAAIGAGVWVLVDLWCPVAYVPHLFVGHVLPFALCTAAGTLLGHFVIALRAA
ncbi:MAG TPA: NrsF family protein [Polyangiaceae bacterium]|nr:NrsF family protein [Polyangiaceae bacterium]